MTSLDPARTPVLVSSGEWTERTSRVDAMEVAERAARVAFEKGRGLEDAIERLTMIDVVFSPVGRRPASDLAARLDLRGIRCERTTGGGNAPQYFVTRAARDIAAGDLRGTVIVGAEAARSARQQAPDVHPVEQSLRSAGGEPDPEDPRVGDSPDRFLDETRAAGFDEVPGEMYALLESALAHDAGRGYSEQRAFLGEILARFSAVAARNPYAWFRDARTADEISTVSEGNRLIVEPYTKLMNAFPYVDQGCALIVTSLDQARRAGLEDDSVFCLSGATGEELDLLARPRLHGSPGLRWAARTALAAAGVDVDEVAWIDLYAAFPSAIQILADAVGVDTNDPRGLTQTGGLPYFGGPGNNYSSHAIASVARRIRESGGIGLVFANTGWAGKGSVGVYGDSPPEGGFRDFRLPLPRRRLPIVRERNGAAVIDAGTIVYDRDGSVKRAPIVARFPDDARIGAQATADTLAGLADLPLVGRKVLVEGTPPRYRFSDQE